MKVRDVMTTEVVTADPETSVNLVARLMAGKDISGIPVVDGGKLVGIVTELDLIVRNTRLKPPAFFALLDARIPLETPAHYHERLRHMLGTLARDVMTEEVVTIGPETHILSISDLMINKHIRRLPVSEDGRIIGMVYMSDVFYHMLTQFLD